MPQNITREPAGTSTPPPSSTTPAPSVPGMSTHSVKRAGENRVVERRDTGCRDSPQSFSIRDLWFGKLYELQCVITAKPLRSHCTHIGSPFLVAVTTYEGKLLPNMGRPLTDSFCVASSCNTSQC